MSATLGKAANSEAPASYLSPVLDQVARDAFARLVLAGPEGMTVRELAEEIGANYSTVGNVLRGASVMYGGAHFARAGRRGRAYRWRVRGIVEDWREPIPNEGTNPDRAPRRGGS